jgi:glutathione peroxidase
MVLGFPSDEFGH